MSHRQIADLSSEEYKDVLGTVVHSVSHRGGYGVTEEYVSTDGYKFVISTLSPSNGGGASCVQIMKEDGLPLKVEAPKTEEEVDISMAMAAFATLESLKYTYHGGAL